MHGLSTLTRLNMSKEEIDEAARRSAAAKPTSAEDKSSTEDGGSK